ncbi:agrin-like isoform X19 [Lineus longissimus]|uniref:agrin-like isoform X19 n=1 Tax=Lineus longissimus TaxID=88925 RepID=UPI00315D71F6
MKFGYTVSFLFFMGLLSSEVCWGCVEKPLALREELADVVMTGTVRAMHPDDVNPSKQVAEVEAKRVMKGRSIVRALPGKLNRRRRKMVFIEGIGDPKFCESSVKKYDTRIFLLSTMSNGHLRLNSSVVRLTLRTIERTDAAVKSVVPVRKVIYAKPQDDGYSKHKQQYTNKPQNDSKDVPYVPRPPPKQKPCEKLYCAYGAVCVEKDNQAKCKCHQVCGTIFTPVCGDDGVTYTNECRLRLASCDQQKRIKVKHTGNCHKKDPCAEKICENGARCVPSVDGFSARCQCIEKCYDYGDSMNSWPVCGVNGVDYKNLCELKKTSCLQMKDIKVKYYGKCDPCKDYKCGPSEVCQIKDNREPFCSCRGICNSEFAPVCASDGRTYSNECIMNREACKAQRKLHVVMTGECTQAGGDHPCESVSCGPWEECRIDRQGRAKCACPPPCEPILRQVCGSNEETYDNECELKRAACQSKKTITIKFMGPCGRDSPCSNHNCEYGAKCIVKSGEPACECPTCMEDMSPVCGTDGISYNNECKLKAENCVKRSNTQVKHQGLCNGCENVRCDFFSICQSDEKGGGKCVCPESCIQDEYDFYFTKIEQPFVDAKVCGSDGATYQNECQLKVTSCRKQKFIMVASYGPCDQCAGIKCPTGARCENGECVCEQFCPERYSPICGSDGQTYMNECVLKRTACLRNTDIEVRQNGDCDIDGWSGSGGKAPNFQSSGTDVCDEESCRFGGVCKNDADAEGTNGCVCNFSCQDESDPSPVCGNDGRIYNSLCSMREASCLKQKDIAVIALSSCKGRSGLDKPCDGNAPLVNARTGLEYDCSTGRDTCPVSTYCHKGLNYAKCCEESMSDSYQVKRCEDRRYGCCPDGKTPAPGPNDAGCPSVCNCNPIGSYSAVCDPITLQCTCKPGVGDRQCNRCEPGYWGLPLINEGNSGCTPCACNPFGAVRDDCEQMTGRCVCKPGITGMKCNMCPDGSVLGPGGCNDSPNSCSTLKCYYGAKCVIKAGMPQCDCEACKDEDFAPIKVCGTDGQTYGSECQLKTFACRLQRDIAVAYEEPCKMSPFPDTTPRPIPRSRKTTRHIGSRKTTRHLTMPTVDPPILTLNGKKFKKQKKPKKAKQMKKNRKSFRGGRRMRQRKLKLGRRRQADYRHDVAIIVPQFAGTSYMELRKIPNANMDLTIEMDFRTLNGDGILLYNGNNVKGGGDFLSLAMKDGYLEFRFDLGSGIAVVKSRKKIALKEFHQITAYRAGQTGILKIDDEKDVISTSPGDLRSLNLNEPLYLGYIPELSKGIIEDIGLDMGLVGCIQSLKVFGRDFMKEYNLVYPESLDVQGARGLVECGNNPCNSLPCQNGGLCMTVDETKFKCICEPGYEGETCSDAIDVCKSNPCAKGSSCINVGDGTYKCKCPFGFSGEHCEKEQSWKISLVHYGNNEKPEPNYQADNFVPKFNGDSYIEYKYNDNAYTKIAFEVWFLTYQDNGVLLYNGQNKDGKGDYLSLNLVNGYLQFKFDLGSGSANIVSTGKVSKNEWHKVVIERNKQSGFMDLNDEARVNGRSKGLLQSLNLDQQLYIGGFRNKFGVTVESGVTTGLRGAIQRLYINGRHIENLPKVASDMERVTAYLGPPCDNNPCLNSGTCLPVLSQVKCKCPMTHGGKYCETALQDISAVAEAKPIQFDGNTFLKYFNRINRKEIGQKSNHFKLRFKTKAKNGLLLIQHKSPHISGDFVTLTIVHGNVELGYNLGNQKEFMTIKSPVDVADGKWHTVEVKRQKRKGSIKVDNGETFTSVSGQGATQLDSDGLLWIGGKQNLPTGLPRKYYESFVGCIKKVEVDNEELNMVKDKQNEVAIVFCDNKYKYKRY